MHRRPRVDADPSDRRGLGRDLVPDGQVGEAGRPLATVRARGCRAGAALASAEHVRGDDEPAVGVDVLARADDAGPPSGGRMPGPGRADHVAVAGEGVQHEHRVARRPRSARPRSRRRSARRAGDRHARATRAQPSELAVADRVALPPGAGRRRLADQGAHIRLGDETRGDRVFRGLPVHASTPVSVSSADDPAQCYRPRRAISTFRLGACDGASGGTRPPPGRQRGRP